MRSALLAALLCLAACSDGDSMATDGATADAIPAADAPVIDAAPVDAQVIDATPPFDAIECEFGDAATEPGIAFDPDIGLAEPVAITRANENMLGVWTDVGPANWSCLGTASTDVPSSVAITLSGWIGDFQTGNDVPLATIAAYADGDVTGVASDTTMTDANGSYTLTLPAGALRPAFAITGQGIVDTHRVHVDIEPDLAAQSLDLYSVSELTANALPAFIGVSRTPGLGLGVWRIFDCNGRAVSNAIATVSVGSECAAPLAGGVTYYFSAGSTSSLPVRHTQQAATNSDGFFMVIEMPPTNTAYVQVWGYIEGQTPGVDAIRRIAEVPVSIIGDTFVTAGLEPLRAQ